MNLRCDNCKLLLAIGDAGKWTAAHCFSIRVRDIDNWIPVLPGQELKLLKRVSVRCICQVSKDIHPNRK